MWMFKGLRVKIGKQKGYGGMTLDQQQISPLRFASVETTGVSFRRGRDEAKLLSPISSIENLANCSARNQGEIR
jgi:hypothetical protein